MFIEHTRGCIIPAGSIVVLSSLTHLADVGVGAYTEDLCAGYAKINRVFRGGLVVFPGLAFPPPWRIRGPGAHQGYFSINALVKKCLQSGGGGGPSLKIVSMT
jgi:hypothetical protein